MKDKQVDWNEVILRAMTGVQDWEATWGPYTPHAALGVDPAKLDATLATFHERLGGNYPFFHPRYAGQMLKPPHPAAMAGYVAAMRINPNNHALDGGPPSAEMEKEVVRDLAAMFHLPAEHLGHLTSSGTIANLEALWVARELHPGQGIAHSAEAHYTHGRMSQVLGMDATAVPVDAAGRMDAEALEVLLRTGTIGTVVVTTGTTALGAVDPVADLVPLCRHYGARVHIDAAYGGFFTLLAWGDDPLLTDDTRRHLRAVAEADSVVVDPHKHGLQPYGCGCVLFRDPTVGRFYRHDSPYTYFTSDALHLGEISLECSRAGAAAAALWFTLQLLPLQADAGLGAVLQAGLRAARHWQGLLEASEVLAPYRAPELDIVTFVPRPDAATASAVDAAAERLFDDAMHDADDPVFLSLLRVESDRLAAALPGLAADQPHARILRSVLMKPEHEHAVPHLHARTEAFARVALEAAG